MNEVNSWQGNWTGRLYERVREQGYESLTPFAEAHPTLSLVELAQKLGGDEVNAVQVFSGLVAEAERSHQPPSWRPLGPDDAFLRTLLPDEEV